MNSKLFEPLVLGNATLKNRFVMAPMGSSTSDAQHHMTEQSYAYYEARAKGGFGLIFTGYMCVSPDGYSYPNQVKICDDESIPYLKEMTERVHRHGSAVFAQLQHSGMINHYEASGCRKVGPSAVNPYWPDRPVHELSQEEIHTLIERFTQAAVRAKAAGFDGVEVHGAHGYLVTQFLSKFTNKRTDCYGGSHVGRARFACEIIASIRKILGPDFPISIRINAVDDIPGGNTIEDTCAMVPLFEQAGANMINVSRGVLTAGTVIAPYVYSEGHLIDHCRKIKAAVSIPVGCVGRINDPCLAESIVAGGAADLVVLGRQALADPEFPNKVREGRFDEIFYCTGCMQRCQGAPLEENDTGVSCLVNPFTGKENRWKIEKTESPKHYVIVGAGVAGLEAAWILAKRGHKVTVLEKEAVTGGQIRLACVPPMKNAFGRIACTYETLARKFGAEIRLNTEANESLLRQLQPDGIILATGAKPLLLPIPGIDGENEVIAHDILAGKVQVMNQKVLVVGAGLVGVETAEVLLNAGCHVDIIDMVAEMAGQMNGTARKMMLKNFSNHGLNFYGGAKVKEFLADGVRYEQDGQEKTIQGYNKVVVAMGARAYNPLKEAAESLGCPVFSIGDAQKAADAKRAIYDAAKLAISL